MAAVIAKNKAPEAAARDSIVTSMLSWMGGLCTGLPQLTKNYTHRPWFAPVSLREANAVGTKSALIASPLPRRNAPSVPETQSGVQPVFDRFLKITNADTGALVSWDVSLPGYCALLTDTGCTGKLQGNGQWDYHLTTTAGGGVASDVIWSPLVPNQAIPVEPILQRQDGSFVGYTLGPGGILMVAFDQSGNLLGYAAGYQPQMATADGGVIANGNGTTATTFDANLNVTGQLASLPTQSWLGNNYQIGSIDQVFPSSAVEPALSFGAFLGGNPSLTPTAVRLHRARAFIPYGLFRQPTCDAFHCEPPIPDSRDTDWRTSAKLNTQAWQSVQEIPLYDEANYGQFLMKATAPSWSVIKRTNEVVAYIGHGLFQPASTKVVTDPNMAMGLLFTRSECLWFNNTYPPPLPIIYGPWNLSCDPGPAPVPNVVQKPQIIFLGLCGVTPALVQAGFWIHKSRS